MYRSSVLAALWQFLLLDQWLLLIKKIFVHHPRLPLRWIDISCPKSFPPMIWFIITVSLHMVTVLKRRIPPFSLSSREAILDFQQARVVNLQLGKLSRHWYQHYLVHNLLSDIWCVKSASSKAVGESPSDLHGVLFVLEGFFSCLRFSFSRFNQFWRPWPFLTVSINIPSVSRNSVLSPSSFNKGT